MGFGFLMRDDIGRWIVGMEGYELGGSSFITEVMVLKRVGQWREACRVQI